MLQRIGSELVQRHAERLHCARLERERRSRNLDLETVIENAELGFEKFPNPKALPLLLSKQIERCGDSPESFVKDIASARQRTSANTSASPSLGRGLRTKLSVWSV